MLSICALIYKLKWFCETKPKQTHIHAYYYCLCSPVFLFHSRYIDLNFSPIIIWFLCAHGVNYISLALVACGVYGLDSWIDEEKNMK